jgi:hypothetical protein
MLRANLVAALVSAALACAPAGPDDGSGNADDDGNDSSCVPGESAACAGPGGCTGYQVCDDDGAFSPCECGAGSPTSGASVGATSGASGPTGAGATSGTPPPMDCGINVGGPAGCDECFAQHCCAYGQACAASQPCQQFGACASSCGNDVNCQINCVNEFPNGYDPYVAIVMCMQTGCPQCVQ